MKAPLIIKSSFLISSREPLSVFLYVAFPFQHFQSANLVKTVGSNTTAHERIQHPSFSSGSDSERDKQQEADLCRG